MRGKGIPACAATPHGRKGGKSAPCRLSAADRELFEAEAAARKVSLCAILSGILEQAAADRRADHARQYVAHLEAVGGMPDPTT